MRLVCALVMLVAPVTMPVVRAADSDAIVAVAVRVAARTSLHVSTEVLEFTVPEGSGSASASIDFTAAVRLPSSSRAVLNIEPAQFAESRRDADTDPEITFAGVGDGMKSGRLTPSGAVAARWQGSGQRRGRIIFTIHAQAPGVYRVPVHLVLATP